MTIIGIVFEASFFEADGTFDIQYDNALHNQMNFVSHTVRAEETTSRQGEEAISDLTLVDVSVNDAFDISTARAPSTLQPAVPRVQGDPWSAQPGCGGPRANPRRQSCRCVGGACVDVGTCGHEIRVVCLEGAGIVNIKGYHPGLPVHET